MQVYLPAIRGLVPNDMVRAVRAFMDFCYLVRRPIINEDDIEKIEEAIARFHRYREVFRATGVRNKGFSLPRQHSMVHYPKQIRRFGAPHGLCTSITESKHIEAVKKPWRRSNKYKALKQMLLTNQRLGKLGAARVDFKGRGMLEESCIEQAYEDFVRQMGSCISAPLILIFQLIDFVDDLDNAGDGQEHNGGEDGARAARGILNPLVPVGDVIGDDGVVGGPRVDGEVKLASKPRTWF